MPINSVLFWAVTTFSGFIWGIYILWKIEKSGVERWGGGSGGLFRLKPRGEDK